MSAFDITQQRPAEPADEPEVRHADAPDVEVRRNGTLFAVVALVCLAVSLAYFVRAFTDGGALSWVMGPVVAALGAAMGLSWWESRTPMLVADAFGVRIRLGSEWRGLPWAALEQVVVEPGTSLLRDGRLVVVPTDEGLALEGLDARGRRQVALSERVYGAALAVPLGMTTRVSVPRLVDTLADLAGTRAAVVELAGWAPEPVVPMDAEHLERREARAEVARAAGDGSRMGASGRGVVVRSRLDPRARAAEGLSLLEDLGRTVKRTVGQGVTSGVGGLVSRLERTPEPQTRLAALDVVLVDGSSALKPDPVEHPLETDHDDNHDQDHDQDPVGAEVPDASWDPAPNPVEREWEDPPPAGIGGRLRAARQQLGYDVRTLSERTRIQPHVIEAIERDDFEPCGGDFYARGHLRSLSSVLGVPPDEVVAAFDAHHAGAPVEATRVFSAELATNRASRAGEGAGRRWAVVLAVVLVLVLAWGLARLFTEQPAALDTPTLNGSAGLASQRAPITSVFGPPVTMSVRGVGGPSKVVVRDRTGLVMWTGTLHAGQRQQLTGVGPFKVTAQVPDHVQVWVEGKNRGTVVSDNAVVGRQSRTFSP